MKKENKNLHEELAELSPFLASQKQQPEGFQVPANYFGKLTDEVMAKVRPAPAPPVAGPPWYEPWVWFWQQLWQPRYALALASVTVLVVAGLLWFTAENSGMAANQLASLEDVPEAELQAYLADNIDEFGTDLLEAQLAESADAEWPGLELEALENYLDGELEEVELDALEELF